MTTPRHARRTAWLAGVALLVSFGAGLLALARSHIDPHDGSCTAVLARNLATTGQYGYAKYDSFELWPVEATTGPTLVLPMALAFRLAGDGPFVANVACTLLVIAAFTALWALLVPQLTSPVRVLSALLALGVVMTVTIEPVVAFVVPRGEIVAALLLVIATLVALGRPEIPGAGRCFASGLLLGLGVASKLLLLLPGAALFLGICLCTLRATGWRRALGAAASWLGGLALVLACLEAWKLLSFGSWPAYAARWAEFGDFFRVAGSGLRDQPSPLTAQRALRYRIGVLYDGLGWTALVFGALLVPWLALPWRTLRTRTLGPLERVALVLGAETLATTVWWLWLAEIPWLRYLFFACVTAPLLAHFLLLELARRHPGWAVRALGIWAAVLVLAVACSPPGTLSWPSPIVRPEARTRAVLEAAEALRTVAVGDPEARFWSAGWWRHWDLQSVRPLVLHDLFDAAAIEQLSSGHDYLVTSDYFNWEQDPKLLALVEAHQHLVAYRNAYFSIYRLHPGMTRKLLRERPQPDTPGAARAPSRGGDGLPPSSP